MSSRVEVAPRNELGSLVSVATLGARRAGKTALTAALVRLQAQRGLAVPLTAFEAWRPASCPAHVEYATPRRTFRHFDCAARGDLIRNAVVGACRPDLALCVVDVCVGVTATLRRDLRLLREAGAGAALVFLNRCDAAEASLIDAAESEARELLDDSGFGKAPVVRGDALAARARPGQWRDALEELVQQLDAMPEPERDAAGPLCFSVEGVLSVRSRGTVAAGWVSRGVARLGDRVELVGEPGPSRFHSMKQSRRATEITGLELHHKRVDAAWPGDYAYMLLRGVELDEIERGDVVAAPGSVTLAKSFEGELYVLSTAEAGAGRDVTAGDVARFDIHNAQLAGRIVSCVGISPGSRGTVFVELTRALPLASGMCLVMRDGTATVGVGRILSALPAS